MLAQSSLVNWGKKRTVILLSQNESLRLTVSLFISISLPFGPWNRTWYFVVTVFCTDFRGPIRKLKSNQSLYPNRKNIPIFADSGSGSLVESRILALDHRRSWRRSAASRRRRVVIADSYRPNNQDWATCAVECEKLIDQQEIKFMENPSILYD